MGRRAEELDLSGARRLGVFGGSFDPVHAGHLHVAREAQRAFGLDHVVFVPAARSPYKPGRRPADAAGRLAMLDIALAGEPTWSVSELELERGPPSYTIDTVRELPGRLGLPPGARLYLLIGWDNLRGLEGWREVAELTERAQPVVVHRGGADRGDLEGLRRALAPEVFARLERGLLAVPPVDVSSSELREALSRGGDPGGALPPGVLEYLRRNGIYQGSPPARP